MENSKLISEVKEQVKTGEKFAVTFGRKKEIIGYFVPEIKPERKRKIGILEGKAGFTFHPNFKMPEEELLD